MKQLGDITKINGAEIEPVDIITAGSPCQDLSIGGKRAGLAGERSGLFMEAMRIVNEMREATNGKYPRFFVWENVYGSFSSNKGLDFAAVLSEIGATEISVPESGKWAYAGLVQCDRCEIAWRGLDAQYWGVPQRRKRIFLVADFAADYRCAGEILFECEGVQGNPASGEGARQGTAIGTEGCAGTADFGGSLTPLDVQSKRITRDDGIAPALYSGQTSGNGACPVLQRPVVLKIRQPKKKGGGSGAMWKEDQAYTLIAHQDMTIFER